MDGSAQLCSILTNIAHNFQPLIVIRALIINRLSKLIKLPNRLTANNFIDQGQFLDLATSLPNFFNDTYFRFNNVKIRDPSNPLED